MQWKFGILSKCLLTCSLQLCFCCADGKVLEKIQYGTVNIRARVQIIMQIDLPTINVRRCDQVACVAKYLLQKKNRNIKTLCKMQLVDFVTKIHCFSIKSLYSIVVLCKCFRLLVVLQCIIN